ncbi:MAG: tyrosine-type recombinase/integrase [Porcipelethomonas sp.]
MSVHKDKNGTWYAMVRYDDRQGKRKQKCKRGFQTKREARDWECRFQLQANNDLDMLFKDFYNIYEQDMKSRLKENTWEHKSYIIKSKILPYFGEKPIKSIQARDVLAWQNELLRYRNGKGNPYSETYLKSVHNQLSAIFNHAVRFYDLPSNPATKAGSIGVKNAKEMNFWTKDEYLRFSEVMMDKPVSYYAFEMLYWCGIRLGELLALTPADFDFENRKLRINKSYQRIKGQDVITEPKTKKSNRIIEMPDFLCEEMQDYISMLYNQKPDERIFPISKSYLHHEMDRGVKATGLKRIRIHDLRHSHVSLLIELGFSAVAIADRVGHESIEITYRYAHLFPSKQKEMANKLSELKKGGDTDVSKKP